MKIIDLEFDKLKRSLVTGNFAYEMTAALNSLHYIWTGESFMLGAVTGDEKLEIPICTKLPNLFYLIDKAAKLKIEPYIYRVKSIAFNGLGIAFHNCIIAE